MMGHNWKYIFTAFLLMAFSYMQSIESLESSYFTINRDIRVLENRIDSLQSVLEQKAVIIDQAKTAGKPEDQIKHMMSDAVVISAEIESCHKELKMSEQRLEDIEKKLCSCYSAMIDSLKNIKVAASGEEIEWQILDYTYRKFFISPGAHELSFKPQKMLALTRELSDTTLIREYITGAISEIDTQLVVVSALYEEIKTVYQLQEQAGAFFDEVEMDQDFRSYPFAYSQSYQYSTGKEDMGFLEDNNSPLNTRQTTSNTLLYRQLLRIIQNPSEEYPVNADTRQMTLDDYKKMLEDLLKYLKSYRIVLRDKIKQMQ
jgi:hypothetical protein